MTLSLHLLGVPRLERDSQIIEIDTRKAVAILAYMALDEERPSREFLATFLWPEFDQSRGRAALRRTLSALRRDVGRPYFDISRDAVAFEPSAQIWVDVAQFRKKSAAGSLADLETAVELYRDNFMTGFTLRDSPDFDEWQYFQSESLRRAYVSVLEQLINGYRNQGEWPAAIRHARRWLALDPLREEAHRSLMSLLAWSGERTRALQQYRDCVRILDEELGVAPLPETTEIYHAIQENQLALPIIQQAAAVSHPPIGQLETPADPSQPQAAGPIPFVGRQAALDILTETYMETRQNGRFVIIGGEAGIGKTRLADEFITARRSEGTRVVATRCYDGEQGLAYGPVVAALRQALAAQDNGTLPDHWRQEIGRLLPELLPPGQTPPPLDGPGAQARFFDAISQSFATLLGDETTQSCGVLCIDDLLWADQATLDLLIYLIRRLPELKLFILGTWRTPDVAQEATMRQQLLAAGQRAGTGRFLPLSRLNQDDIQSLLRQLNRSAESARQLFDKTEGLPFFLNAYLTRPDTVTEGPDSFRDLLYTRLAGVDQTGRQLLQTAAVIGRSFDFDTLRTASGRSDEEMVQAIETLLAYGLVIESAATTADLQYDFSHQALRDLVYEETSLARRRLLHRRVAESLGHQRNRPEGAIAAQVAHHYQAAGLEPTAADYFYQAGNYARQLYANTEALSHFQSALALGHPAVADLHEAIGDLHKLAGAYGTALADYEKAAALADPDDLYRLEQKLGSVYHRQGDWELAVHHFSAALEALDEEEHPARARILADWSRTAHRAGDIAQAQSLAEEALKLAETADDLPALAQTHNILGMLARARVDFSGADYHLRQSLELAPQLPTPRAQIAALNNLALLARDQFDFTQAEQLLTQALQLCRTLGDRHREAALLNNLADLYHLSGDKTAAQSHVRQSVAILAEIGTDAGQWQPEIWKLTEW
ncbi:MAG: tetratricopeptide repeat protein [Candidatus Promineifilaceae bacterium]